MTQIAATDRALVQLIEGCDFPGTTVMSAPHEWDAGFVTRLLDATPALLIAFLGADQPESRMTELTLDGRWACYIAVGWNGRDQAARRLGAGAGFDLMHRVAAAFHNVILKDENGDTLTHVIVDGLGVVTDSALDIANLWVGEISLDIELPLDLDPSHPCHGPLDDWLRIGLTIDIEGGEPRPDIADAGDAGDIAAKFDLPQ